jgi:hypothetical protein
MAYESDQSGSFEIYVQPYPDVQGGLQQISTAGGTRPLWSRDGRELFYIAPDDALMGVRADTTGTWTTEAPVKIVESGRYFSGSTTQNASRSYDVSADGRRFLRVKEDSSEGRAVQDIIVVQNWFEELKRLVPVN